MIDGLSFIESENRRRSQFVAKAATDMYANNIYNIIDECWDQEKAVVNIDLEDEILSGCIVSYAGELVNAFVKKGD